MRARFVFLFAIALTGCELLFPTHETGGVSAGGSTSTSSAGGTNSSSSSSGGEDSGCGEALPSDFCSREAPDGSFCSDFNEHQLPKPWKDTNQVPDGGTRTTVHLDSKVVHSPGGSVRFDGLPTVIDAGCKDELSTRLVTPIGQAVTDVHVDFYYLGCKALPIKDATLLKVGINCEPTDSASTFDLFGWGMDHDGDFFELNGAPSGEKKSVGDAGHYAPPSATEWTHVKIHVVIGSTGSADVEFGCTNVFHREGDTTCPGDHGRSLLIGMFTCSDVPDCSIYFDDVVLTAE